MLGPQVAVCMLLPDLPRPAHASALHLPHAAGSQTRVTPRCCSARWPT